LTSKNRLIDEFQEELRQKDGEYVAQLRQQADDVDTVIDRMKRHTKSMFHAYRKELAEIETAFLEERRRLLQENREQLDALYDQRRTLEKTFLEKRLLRAEEQSEELDKIREKDSQDYNQLKIDLQKDIQELEQEAEEMRARYLLNSEKLDYNFRVLSERVVDNKHTITQNKRKLARLQDALSVVVTKYNKADKQYKQENQELTDQYKRITEQFKDLQQKFKQFEKQDIQQYKEVWEMNAEQAKSLMDKLFAADRIISEQQLGQEWTPPSEDLLALRADADGRDSALSAAEAQGASAPAAAFRAGATPARPLTEAVKKMMQMLCDEAGFLVEERVTTMIQKLDKNEQNLLKIDSILRTLGVETQAEIESMLPYFTKAAPGVDPSRAPLISPDDVVKAVRTFVEDQQRQAARQANVVTLTAEERAAKRRREQEREFWEKLGKCIPEHRQRLWNALEDGLTKYHDLLVSRSNLLLETDSMRQQNEELRALLDQYMSAKINEELYVPPALGGLYRA
jgi:dynein regulatory complex protein 1